MPKKIAVIDGNSLMHRAYHAVPQTMNAPDGRPTNAVFGFIAMLLKFIDIASPDALICAFDAGRPAFRMEALEQYKSQRPPDVYKRQVRRGRSRARTPSSSGRWLSSRFSARRPPRRAPPA